MLKIHLKKNSLISFFLIKTNPALSIGSIFKLTLGWEFSKLSLMCITMAVTFVHGYVNMRDLGTVSILNQWSVFWSCMGLVVIIALLSAFADHNAASWVFTHYENETGFENKGYVLILGMIGAAYSLFGKRKWRF
jgi:amino acid transporter